MKKFNLVLLVVLISFFSCQTDNGEIAEPEAELNLQSMKDLTYSKIGVHENGDFKLVVTESSILSVARKFSAKMNLGFEPQFAKVVTIEDKKYLRIYSKDNLVSTIELILDDSNNYQTGSTVCTSKICASEGGCIPNGLYCTECRYGNGELKGDCLRTTMSEPEEPVTP